MTYLQTYYFSGCVYAFLILLLTEIEKIDVGRGIKNTSG
jgi:hypothetical protein